MRIEKKLLVDCRDERLESRSSKETIVNPGVSVEVWVSVVGKKRRF